MPEKLDNQEVQPAAEKHTPRYRRLLAEVRTFFAQDPIEKVVESSRSPESIEHTRSHPPLLPNDVLTIGSARYTVAQINKSMLCTEWASSEQRGELRFFKNTEQDKQRPVAVVWKDDNRKDTYYLFLGRRKKAGKRFQSETVFQLVPAKEAAESVTIPPQTPFEKLASQLEDAPFLANSTSLYEEFQAYPLNDIHIDNKVSLPEEMLNDISLLRAMARESAQVHQAAMTALKVSIPLAFIGSLVAVLPPGTTLENLPTVLMSSAPRPETLAEMITWQKLQGTMIAMSGGVFGMYAGILDSQLEKRVTKMLANSPLKRLATWKPMIKNK